MGDEAVPQPSFWPGRRWRIGFHVALSSAAMFAIVIMVNYIAARHFKRAQWTNDNLGRLSPVTLRVLDSLTNQVKVIVFYDRRQPLYSAVSKLLNKYQARSSRLEIDYLDYTIYPGRAEETRKTFDLDATEKGDRVIFFCNGQKKMVYARELSEFDYSGLFTERKVKRTTFKGEQLFTSALCGVIDPRPIKAYFLQGHGEHDPADADEQRGYLDFAKVLQENNIAVGRLGLFTNDVPADCQLLIVANPMNPIAPAELEKIEKYLNQGGRLLALFGYLSIGKQSGMEKLLMNWGVGVGWDWVTDDPQSKSSNPGEVVVTDFRDHLIVKPLRRSRLLLIAPRSISRKTAAQRSADATKVTELAFTSPAGVVHKGPNKTDRKGQIPLMVAVEKGSIQGLSSDRGETRIVVVGESMFLNNQVIDFEANRDFARLAVNWLVNREVLLAGMGPQPIQEYTITMTRAEMKTVRWLLLAGLPGSVLLIGFLVWIRRRS